MPSPVASNTISTNIDAANTQDTTTTITSAPNGIILNGHVSNTNQANQTNTNNNLNNRKVVGKSKWVPLPIELPKSRKPREPRERNNNVSSNKQRRDTDNETEYCNSNEANEAKNHPEKPVISSTN